MVCVHCRAAVLLLPLFVIASTLPSQAAGNEKITGSFSFTDSRTCATPIQVAGSYNEQMHTYYDNAGVATRLAFTGKVQITYTNLSTGATYSPNSSGPSTVDLQNGQTVLRGGNGALFNNDGNLVSTDGRVVLDASGNVISLTGHSTGVCTQLGTAPAS
jgi:hypothetical protein